uniref:Uncharacterized protein n=1 Tax=Cacopsylla melanoneura TaxID=428564 RepID=A0A8D8Y1K9_9HEMI
MERVSPRSLQIDAKNRAQVMNKCTFPQLCNMYLLFKSWFQTKYHTISLSFTYSSMGFNFLFSSFVPDDRHFRSALFYAIISQLSLPHMPLCIFVLYKTCQFFSKSFRLYEY